MVNPNDYFLVLVDLVTDCMYSTRHSPILGREFTKGLRLQYVSNITVKFSIIIEYKHHILNGRRQHDSRNVSKKIVRGVVEILLLRRQ